MLRGRIWLVELEPAVGSEANKRRPVVIISNDRANQTVARSGRGVITVVPLTSNVTRVFTFQTLFPAQETGLRMDSKAQAEQVRAISPKRFVRPLGAVPFSLLQQLEAALRLHLEL